MSTTATRRARPPQGERTAQVKARMTPEAYRAARIAALRRGLTVQDVVEKALDDLVAADLDASD